MKKILLLTLLVSIQQHGVPTSAPFWCDSEALCIAAYRGRIEDCRAILDAGVSLEDTFQGETPLMWASKAGQVECLRELLARGADMDQVVQGGWTALRVAVWANQRDSVSELLSRGASNYIGEETQGVSVLALAVRHDDAELVRLIIKSGAQVDSRNGPMGDTPLQLACMFGATNSITCLLAEGADLEAVNVLGRGAAHSAASTGKPAVIEQLARRQANLGARDMLGLTPLHLAVEARSTATAECILRNAPQTNNVQDLHGLAPIHVAAVLGDISLARLLLERGSNPGLRTELGRTAQHYAAMTGSEALIALLSNDGARQERDEFGRLAEDYRPLGSNQERLSIVSGAPYKIMQRDQVLQARRDSDAAPLIALATLPGYTTTPSGFVGFALWEDGTVLFCCDSADPLGSMRIGRIAQREMEILLRELDETGCHDKSLSSVDDPHAPVVTLLIRGASDAIQRWDRNRHGKLGLGATISRILQMVQASIQRCIPSESMSYAQVQDLGTFRGYEPGRAGRTPWLRRPQHVIVLGNK